MPYSFFPKQVKLDSNLVPSKIRLILLMYLSLLPVVYIDYLLGMKGIFLGLYIFTWLYISIKYIYKLKQKAKETFLWKKLEAKVLDKDIYQHNTLIRHTMYPYQLRLKYSFTINGETIVSDQFALGQFGDKHCNYFFDTIENVRLFASKLMKDDKVYVYVNQNTNESVVMQGYQSAREPSYIALMIVYSFPFLIQYFTYYAYFIVPIQN